MDMLAIHNSIKVYLQLKNRGRGGMGLGTGYFFMYHCFVFFLQIDWAVTVGMKTACRGRSRKKLIKFMLEGVGFSRHSKSGVVSFQKNST